MEDMNGYAGRFRRLREHFNMSQRKFSEFIGTSNSYVSAVESGRTIPGGDVLTKMVTALPHLSCRWLLTGEGEMLVDPIAITANASATPAPIPTIPELVELTDVLKAARVGAHAAQWAVLEALQQAGPEGLSVFELAEKLRCDKAQLEGWLAVLHRKQAVRQIELGRVTLATGAVGLRAQELENAAQHVRAVLNMLVTNVMPRVERNETGATLLMTEVRLPRDMSRQMVQRILGQTMSQLQQAEEPDGEESLQVVMAFSGGMTVTMPLKTT